MNTKKLEFLIQKILKEMEVKGYRPKTIENERCTFNQLLKYCTKNNINNYNKNIGMKFLDEHYNISKYTINSRYRCRRLRSIYLIEWYLKKDDITKKIIPRTNKVILPKSYSNVINEYKTFLLNKEYSNATINHKIRSLNMLFKYAINKNINKYENITKNIIYNFLFEIKKLYSNSSLYLIKYDIKNFYDYLFQTNKSDISGNSIFPKIIKKDREKLPSYYTKDEIKKVLTLVDITSKVGKRDYAVLLLAITYGLRNCDIINLTFDNLDWKHNKINIMQRKTKEKLELNLTESVKFSLIDYIKNARPDYESNHIFLKFKFPYEYTENSSLYKSLKKYIDISDIELRNRKKGLHSLRHSCATNLLSNNTQLPIISSILGHSTVESTKRYLSIGIEQLKKISLEVPTNE